MPKSKRPPAAPAQTFKETMADLESIIKQIEGEESSLEESLEAFEKGVKLIREAQQALASAQQKVSLLIEENAVPVASEFSEIQDTE